MPAYSSSWHTPTCWLTISAPDRRDPPQGGASFLVHLGPVPPVFLPALQSGERRASQVSDKPPGTAARDYLRIKSPSPSFPKRVRGIGEGIFKPSEKIWSFSFEIRRFADQKGEVSHDVTVGKIRYAPHSWFHFQPFGNTIRSRVRVSV